MRLNKTAHAPCRVGRRRHRPCTHCRGLVQPDTDGESDRIQPGGKGGHSCEANCYYTAFWPRSFMAIPRS